jgi:hypothetical protein
MNIFMTTRYKNFDSFPSGPAGIAMIAHVDSNYTNKHIKNTLFLPYKSAYLGTNRDPIANPVKKNIPRDDIVNFEAQFRLNLYVKLYNEV